MKSTALFVSLLTPWIIPVAAHGWVGSITVAGKLYEGNSPGASAAPSVIRLVDTNSPVTSVSDPNLACGPNAQLAQDVADANPGDPVDVDWVSTAGAWFHDVGPMLTYLSSCGSESCTQFDASQAMWFKIQQSGRDSSGKWVQADLNSGVPANLTLPSNLAAGNYLLRHEIIALQNGVSQGGAEFYASCSQLSVGGSGSGAPTAGELVKLPGAYSATDPGILVDVYSNPNAPYTFPGPPIAAFVSGGASVPPANPSANPPGSSGPSSPSNSSGSSGPPKTTSTPTGTATASSPSRTCELRRNTLIAGSSSVSSPSAVKRMHRALRNFSVFRK
ncbi:glycosyl hydrolase family 61-domain-containing protein [Mycena rosella]|uniref:lytic cellulose monooxygenase (C4-dehydrogenating) n=1 Tax=Mycena rosella TaxID=1033263 RepID=A0AAD7CYA9_MYCRO|nr:glycosyl hydrolase family 61-domain-containing protein [Mycena rosella]